MATDFLKLLLQIKGVVLNSNPSPSLHMKLSIRSSLEIANYREAVDNYQHIW